MTLENFTAHLNASTFWKEFTFSQTKFSPRPTQQVELADGVVLIGSEPPRLCRRPQLLRGWGYDEQDDEQVLA